jgi:homoserine kinase type II
MNSATWIVTTGSHRFVAKLVNSELRDQFAGGLAVAAALDRPDLPTGAPRETLAGGLLVDVDGPALALLRWVPGVELTANAQRLIGRTLARAHRRLAGTTIEGAEAFHWVDPDAAHLALEPWIAPAVREGVAAVEKLPRLTTGLLHSDPAPEAFRHDVETGVCGLIDWGVGLRGPYLYDLASAVMYVGGSAVADELVSAYLDDGPIDHDEVAAGLETMIRFRWVVQADYFARRIADGDFTGIDESGNDTGLDDARRHLAH